LGIKAIYLLNGEVAVTETDQSYERLGLNRFLWNSTKAENFGVDCMRIRILISVS